MRSAAGGPPGRCGEDAAASRRQWWCCSPLKTAVSFGTSCQMASAYPFGMELHPIESTATATVGSALTACPLCHTAGPVLADMSETSTASWRCAVCHQAWSVQRLATVAAYVDYCEQRKATASVPLKR